MALRAEGVSVNSMCPTPERIRTGVTGRVSIDPIFSLSDLNRLVRTRMLGGVGAGEGDLPGYPIRCDGVT